MFIKRLIYFVKSFDLPLLCCFFSLLAFFDNFF